VKQKEKLGAGHRIKVTLAGLWASRWTIAVIGLLVRLVL
jgi:hypothetical protein